MSDEKDDRKDEIDAFRDAVNMTPKALETWLDTDESKDVGQKSSGGSESTGHESGRKILEILHKKKGEYDDDDFEQMKRTVSYVHRHLAQKPEKVEGSRWEASLKNWGHDPSK